jgi:hypothetical protein
VVQLVQLAYKVLLAPRALLAFKEQQVVVQPAFKA